VDPKSGAAGANHAWVTSQVGQARIRRQEVGELLVAEGLTRGLPDRVRLGLRALAFGLDLQLGEGGFAQYESARPCYAGTAFFTCAAAAALSMLEGSSHPKGRELRHEWCPGLSRAALWLATQPPERDDLANHVCGAAGAAAAVSALCPDESLAAAARRLWNAACRIQNPDGSWPERGGTDTLYQAISLIYACYALVTLRDQESRDRLGAALARGFNWLRDRVREDGEVDCSGNARKRWDREPPDNEAILASDFTALTYALRMWAAITEQLEWDDLAERIGSWVERAEPVAGRRTWWENMAAEA